MDSKSILEMSQGAIMERVNYEMGKVIQNILDPNTKPDAKRKLTITMTLTPSADRKTIDVKTVSKSTLVATDAITTGLFITSQPGTGEMVVAELTPRKKAPRKVRTSEAQREWVNLSIMPIPYHNTMERKCKDGKNQRKNHTHGSNARNVPEQRGNLP